MNLYLLTRVADGARCIVQAKSAVPARAIALKAEGSEWGSSTATKIRKVGSGMGSKAKMISAPARQKRGGNENGGSTDAPDLQTATGTFALAVARWVKENPAAVAAFRAKLGL